jgi:hypothetical protein
MRTSAGAVACAAVAAAAPAHAEWFAAAYLGGAHTIDSDLTVSQPDGVHLFRGVPWESRSFESPPYYGVQFGTYFAAGGAFGLRVDFCHDKVFAQRSLAPTLDRFSLSHGLNSVTLDALVRHRWNRLALYGGAGFGTIVPHVEAITAAGSVDEYQWFRGIAAKALAGVSVDIAGPLAAFAEVRATWIRAWVDIPGGDARASFFTEHASLGVMLRL